MRDYVDSVGANFGRVRVIKLEPQAREQAIRSIHRDDNNRFNPDDEGWVVRSWLELTDNPDSYMLLMDNGPTACPTRRPRSACRCTAAPASSSTPSACGTSSCTRARRRATRSITSFETGPVLGDWIDAERSPVSV